MRRGAPGNTLYKTDADIAAELGIDLKEWRAMAIILERQGLPKGDPLFGGRRYWPACLAFLDRRNGLSAPSLIPARRGEEHWEDENA